MHQLSIPVARRARRPVSAPWTAIALGTAAMLSACGGSGSDTPSSGKPQIRMSVSATEDFAGQYGSVGAYEKVSGTLHGEVDPKDPKNAVIQDLQLAPVNARGMVEYSTDFVLLKPKDRARPVACCVMTRPIAEIS